VLTAETATSVSLRKEEGVEQTILRKDIEEMAASPISIMPEDVEKVVSPQDVADLIAFLRESYTPAPAIAKQPLITLFEDQASLVEALSEGSGTVRLRTENAYSGKACLAVTPPQRFSPRIADWGYRITENPGPGEFRYLRFAWKSRGDGIMLELAADGAWPSANEAVRRYYSGKNTTGWAARQLAPEAPKEWVVLTCDLWKDFGSFTLTGIAPTAMGGEALFDRIELLRCVQTP
jgi:hypothetical protein